VQVPLPLKKGSKAAAPSGSSPTKDVIRPVLHSVVIYTGSADDVEAADALFTRGVDLAHVEGDQQVHGWTGMVPETT
jgi:hypothetical protein